MQSFFACLGVSIFWTVLALLYLALAIGTWILSKPVLENLGVFTKERSFISIGKKGKIIDLESTLHRAFKTIIITDIVGFFLANFAAFISGFIS